MKVFEKPANVIMPVLLFLVYTPGLFFTAIKNDNKYVVAVVHALLFGATYALLLTIFPSYY